VHDLRTTTIFSVDPDYGKIPAFYIPWDWVNRAL
jgi:hypothetical protein